MRYFEMDKYAGVSVDLFYLAPLLPSVLREKVDLLRNSI